MAQSTLNRVIVKTLRSPYWPALLSGLVAPGVGQIVNKELRKGLLLLFASLGSFFYFSRIVTDPLERLLPGTPDQWHQNQEALKAAIMTLIQKTPGLFLTFHLFLILLWVFGVVDAYLTAKNRKKVRTAPPDHVNG